MTTAADRFLGLLASLYSFATASHRRAISVLVVATAVLFLPGFATLQPMDRDEPRFAQATKQMLETGDFVRIRFQQQARNNKPAGIYWLQAGAVTAGQALGVDNARRTIWLYRLSSLAGAISAVLLTYWLALAFVPTGPALLAALLLASTVLLGVEAHLAKTDAVLLATVVAAMGALARMVLTPSRLGQSPGQTPGQRQGLGQDGKKHWRLPAIFWTAIGAGLLIKGPITPMVPLFTGIALVIWNRSAPWFWRLKVLPGLLWALVLALPWFVLIMVETKGAFLADSVGKDMLAKVGSGKESHGAPPLVYFAAFWLTAWPMAPLAALAAPFAWAQRHDLQVRFLLAWIVPVWILFELVPTKLPHYVLPVYPAIAVLVAMALDHLVKADAARWRRAILWLVVLVPAVLAIAGIALAVQTRALPAWQWFLFTPLALLLAWFATRPAISSPQRVLAAVLSAMALYHSVYSGILTGGPGKIAAISPQLAAMTRAGAASGCADPLLASAGYYEPSLVFLTRTDMRFTDGAGAAAFLAAGRCRMAFVDIRQEAAFKPVAGKLDGVQLAGRVKGLNLNGGKRLDIGVWLRK
ncbi:MAG: glycosyltransferase family 39 protein [Hyphomicrobiales bacterium]|nr:glycosyltransferase family 39 protein [Hyphomicrobiales bacterium]